MFKKTTSLILLILPLVTFAAVADNLLGLLLSFISFVNIIIIFLVALSTLIFLWGILLYVIYGNDPNKKAEARGYIVYGLATLFVMVSVWALTNLISSALGLEQGLQLPDIKNGSADQHIVLIDNK